jgi:hypothetical protein
LRRQRVYTGSFTEPGLSYGRRLSPWERAHRCSARARPSSSEEQRRRFGRFTEDPDEGQLAGSFLLDQTARRRAMAARGARNRIGWAVQLGTIRYLGTFLDNPEEVPAVVTSYVAEQLGLEPAAFTG